MSTLATRQEYLARIREVQARIASLERLAASKYVQSIALA